MFIRNSYFGGCSSLHIMQKTHAEQKLEQVEQKIRDLISSEEYKDLANKNRYWAQPKPTEQEKGKWNLLQEQKEEFWQNAILRSNGFMLVIGRIVKNRNTGFQWFCDCQDDLGAVFDVGKKIK